VASVLRGVTGYAGLEIDTVYVAGGTEVSCAADVTVNATVAPGVMAKAGVLKVPGAPDTGSAMVPTDAESGAADTVAVQPASAQDPRNATVALSAEGSTSAGPA
jgi:hypothetical protein